MMRIYFFVFFTCIVSPISAQILIKGKVIDAANGESLPFLTVTSEKTGKGVQTDVEGNFSIKVDKIGTPLVFSFVGYTKLRLPASPEMLVKIHAEAIGLEGVIFRFRDPALRVIQQATKNKVFNNPDNFPAYSYRAYTKSILTTDKENLQKIDSFDRKTRKIAKRLEDSEFFVNETVVSKQFLFPSQSKEIIEASRTSGSKTSTILGSMGLLLQPFSFYPDLITFKGRRIQEIMEFVNPLSQNSVKAYDFRMTDTLFVGKDSTFIIEFSPKKGSAIKGMKGEIRINSDGYAIEEISAEPAVKSMLMSVKISQEYEKIEGKWFPKHLWSEWSLPEFKVGDIDLVYKIETQIENVSFRQSFQQNDFNEKSITIADDATYKDNNYWKTHRAENLSEREQKTFEYYENLSGIKKAISSLSLNLAEWGTSGMIPISKTLDLSAQNLFDSNLYEGFRPTINILTSPNFSKMLRFDGKLAYGFNDKLWKYEGRAKLNFDKNANQNLTLQYRKDISEPGNVQYFIWNFPQIPYELIRTYLISRADILEQYKAEFKSKVFRFGTLSVSYLDEMRTPTYKYSFIEHDAMMMDEKSNMFHAQILSVGYRWALGEKFSQIGRGSIITEVPKIVLLLNFEQGKIDYMFGKSDFSKLNAKVEYTHKSTRIGDTFLNLSLGKTIGEVPYTYLYNGRGSKLTAFSPIIWAANHFNTMGLYEFTSDQYANLFVTHNFKELLGKTNVSWSKPNFSLIQSIAYGSLKNKENHQGIDIKTLEKGYFESGVTVDNLIRIKLRKLAYLGAGVGTFYRWGGNRLPVSNDNFTHRIVWNIGF